MDRKIFSKLKIREKAWQPAENPQLPVVYDAESEELPETYEKTETAAVSVKYKKSPVSKMIPAGKIKAVSGKLKPLRKKLKRGGTAAVLGLSVSLAGLFNSPSDLMQQQVIKNLNPDYAVEIMIDEDAAQEPDDRKKAEEGSGSGGIFSRAKDAVRNFIRGLPQGVKACVFIPLWAVGYAIIHLVSFLAGSAVSPAVGHIIGLAMFALILLAVYAATMKCLFPKMPLRKILSLKNIMKVLAGAAILEILDIFLPMFWQDYIRFRDIVLSAAGTVILGIIIFSYLRHRKKRKLRRLKAAQLHQNRQGRICG